MGRRAAGKRFRRPALFLVRRGRRSRRRKWRANRASSDCSNVAREIAVRAEQPPRPGMAAGSVWPVRDSWNRATENLFSAWIERLFEAPLGDELSWPALHVGLRDRSRNILFNHLGLGEDEMKMVLRPDCADLPYFLRAYFAFKMGLPFGYAKCTRGGGGRRRPRGGFTSIESPDATAEQPSPPRGATPSAAATPARRHRPAAGACRGVRQYRQGHRRCVHSGSARTRAS